MRKKILFVLAFLAAVTSAQAALVSPDSDRGTFGIDMHFLLKPSEFQTFAQTPGATELRGIINMGARLLEWVDVLQKELPVDEREQIWRRIDRVGHEPTPDHPMYYNERIILENFNNVIATTPEAILEVLRARTALPTSPPTGFDLKTLVDHLRPIHASYSRTSRWLVLYEWRYSLKKNNRDFRGVLKVIEAEARLTEMSGKWAQLSEAERTDFVNTLSLACPMTSGTSESSCRSKGAPLITAPDKGGQAQTWLAEITAKSKRELGSRFGVRSTHYGVGTSTNGGYHEIQMPTYGIEADVFSWIQERVDEAWAFKNSVGVKLFSVATPSRGAVKVRWEKGALPNVNGIAGDVITMDSNTPKWLDHTQTVMRHEMGHVLGFTDCYTEFWDESLGAFTYYSLDPSDAMCALSGEYLERHRDALLKGYFGTH